MGVLTSEIDIAKPYLHVIIFSGEIIQLTSCGNSLKYFGGLIFLATPLLSI